MNVIAPEWFGVIAIVAFLAVSYFYYSIRTGVPTFPSLPAARDKIIGLLREDMARAKAKTYKICDLGSGSGQLSFAIARTFPDAEVVGIELSLFPWLRATLWQKLTRQPNLRYLRTDFFKYPISDADAVLIYLMEGVLPKVGAKLQRELRPSTMVISNKYHLPGWQPEQTLPLPFTKRLLVYRQT